MQSTEVQGTGVLGVNLEQTSHQLTVIEVGYAIHKLLKKHRRGSSIRSPVIISALLNMVGHDTVGDVPQFTDTYLNYVKTWMTVNDRGGLQHILDDTYRFFVAMEMITYKLLEVGESKEKVMCEVTRNENVVFLWKLTTDISDHKLSIELLREATQEWFTIRGFSITSQLMEQYKAATKRTLKESKVRGMSYTS